MLRISLHIDSPHQAPRGIKRKKCAKPRWAPPTSQGYVSRPKPQSSLKLPSWNILTRPSSPRQSTTPLFGFLSFFALLYNCKNQITMRLSLSVVISALAAATSALSTTGSRLLVVLDDVADKAAYGQFFGDLTGKFPLFRFKENDEMPNRVITNRLLPLVV